MSVGPVLTLGLGAFTGGGVKFLPTLGYGTAGLPPAPTASIGPGGSGRHYNTSSLDLAKWSRNRRKLEAKVEKVEVQIEKKRKQLDQAKTLLDTKKLNALAKQLNDLQKLLLELLAQIDEMNKQNEQAEMEEVLAIYLAYRSIH